MRAMLLSSHPPGDLTRGAAVARRGSGARRATAHEREGLRAACARERAARHLRGLAPASRVVASQDSISAATTSPQQGPPAEAHLPQSAKALRPHHSSPRAPGRDGWKNARARPVSRVAQATRKEVLCRRAW
jgi:hypothetical protein